jgi:two-component system, OmpR family, sensor histidine kinase TctE
MSLPPDSATSIRRRLLFFLLPSLAALMLAGAFVDYRAATLVEHQMQEQRLTDAALALSARIRVEADGQHITLQGADVPLALTDGQSTALRYSIVAPTGRVVAGDPQLQSVPPASSVNQLDAATTRGSAAPALVDAHLGKQRIRLATVRVPTPSGDMAVNVAEANDSRTAPIRYMLATRWLIDFILLDVTLLVVWIGVHYGLKPLLAVRNQIEVNPPRDLRPLEVSGVPSEVRPLVDALNLLFEMLREAARAQRQFVADTAHQLRTPLAGLLGHLEVMLQESTAAPLHARLATLHDGLTRLAHSASQLLALARADPHSRLEDEFGEVELCALVERILEQHVVRSVASGHDIGAEAQSAQVKGNERLLEDLLGNLIDNALNYTPRGGHVTVRCGSDGAGSYLEVEDDGPGIPEAERMHVRQRFYRIAGSPGRGCGLGLAIVEEISRLHRADVAIDAGAEGRGTCIRVHFPPLAPARRAA